MSGRYRTGITRFNLGRVSDERLQADLDGELAKRNPTADDRAWVAALKREIDRRKVAREWSIK